MISANPSTSKTQKNLMAKGLNTKAVILDAALDLAGKEGLEGITIGTLADIVDMSKSGLFAHFGSREGLQVEVAREYYRRFEKTVFLPALSKPKGLPRLRHMINTWLEISISDKSSGCFFISGAIEFDDRPGEVRNELVRSVEDWRQAILRAIRESVQMGHLKKSTDAQALLFQIYSFVLGVHHDSRFLQNPKSIGLAKRLIKKIISDCQIPIK